MRLMGLMGRLWGLWCCEQCSVAGLSLCIDSDDGGLAAGEEVDGGLSVCI